MVGGEQVAYDATLTLVAIDGDGASLQSSDRYPDHEPVQGHQLVREDAAWRGASIVEQPRQALLLGPGRVDCEVERRSVVLADGSRLVPTIWRHAGAGIPDHLIGCDHPAAAGPDAVLTRYDHRDASSALVEARDEWVARTASMCRSASIA